MKIDEKWKKLNTSHPELQNQLLPPIRSVQFFLLKRGFPWLNILKFFTQYCWQLLCVRSPYSGGGLTQIKGVSVLSDFANNIGKVKLIFQAPIAWNINFTCLVKLILQARGECYQKLTVHDWPYQSAIFQLSILTSLSWCFRQWLSAIRHWQHWKVYDEQYQSALVPCFLINIPIANTCLIKLIHWL